MDTQKLMPWYCALIFSISITLTIKTDSKPPPFLSQKNHRIHHVIDNMSLEEKIGQLFMATVVIDKDRCALQECVYDYPMSLRNAKNLIQQHHIGGVIFLHRNTIKQQKKAVKELQSLSKIPLLIGQDLEPGAIMQSRIPELPQFPDAQQLGTMTDEAVYQTGKQIGQICRSLGVHINFAPVADINSNPDNPVINKRAFGDNKKIVALKAEQFMRGLHNEGILSCAKHFPGHGDTSTDSHHELPIVTKTEDELNNCELYPFAHLIQKGVCAVMTGHLAMHNINSPEEQNLPASLSQTITTDILQKELGFKGLVITDALDMRGVTDQYPAGQRELKAFQAGNDIVLCSTDTPRAIATIKKAIQEKTISERELNHRVYKILCAKEWADSKKYLTLQDN